MPGGWFAESPVWQDAIQYNAIRSLLVTLAIALLLPVIFKNYKIFAVLWLLVAGVALGYLYVATGFDMIYRVDHPSFVYRFWSLSHTFPNPGFYDPHWNAGMPVPYLVATGIWSIGIFLLPLFSTWPVESVYTPALAIAFLGVFPLLAWKATAWTGASSQTCWIAALLALAPGHRFFVHLLHYGTIGSSFSMIMALPISVLWYRFLYVEPSPRLRTLLPLFFFALIFFSWPGSLVIAIPFALVAVPRLHKFTASQWACLLLGLAGIFACLWPLARVPMRYSDIAAFTQTTSDQSLWIHFRNGLELLSHNIRSTNALIVVFGFLGAWFGPSHSSRKFFAPLSLMLVLLSGWGEEFKELLQSERLIIPAACIAIIPAARWINHFLQVSLRIHPGQKLIFALHRVVTAWIISLLLLTAYQGARAWRGDRLAPFHTMPEYIHELVEYLSEEVPIDGRVMFAGRAVHSYGGGKIAALPMLTGREMMAADFYGFSPKLVEYEYPPRVFRQAGPDGLFAFKELYNVTHIVTVHDNWKAVYERDPEHYVKAHTVNHISIFAVREPRTLFLHGEGHVQAGFDHLNVQLISDERPIVIKYHWAEGLKADEGVRLFPYDAGWGVTLIGCDPGSTSEFSIWYRP